jgi:hypothetical protein
MPIHIEPLYLLFMVVVWLFLYLAAYWIVAITRDPSLVCWAVGPFGVMTMSLREPPARHLVVQFVAAASVLAAAVYTSLFVVHPAPIAGLRDSLGVQITAVAVPVIIATVGRLAALLVSRRFPLWGEARVLTGIHRSAALGARVYFTPQGRAYVRDRFGITPHEFLRLVR